MAVPMLWRHSDDYLISDKCQTWERWQQQTGVHENELLVGGAFHVEQLGATSDSGTAVFLFADDKPNSTLANLDILKQCRANVEEVRFRDFRGDTWVCEITTDIGIEPAKGSLVNERNLATVGLRRKGPA